MADNDFSHSFIRASREALAANPELAEQLTAAINLVESEYFQPEHLTRAKLKYKLKLMLKGLEPGVIKH